MENIQFYVTCVHTQQSWIESILLLLRQTIIIRITLDVFHHMRDEFPALAAASAAGSPCRYFFKRLSTSCYSINNLTVSDAAAMAGKLIPFHIYPPTQKLCVKPKENPTPL